MPFRIWRLLIKARLCYWFGVNGKYRDSYISLITKNSYRIRAKDGNARKLALNLLKQSVRMIWQSPKLNPQTSSTQKVPAVLYAGLQKHAENMGVYFRATGILKPSLLIGRDEIAYRIPKMKSFIWSINLGFLLLTYLPHILFSSKNGHNYALLIIEWVEWHFLTSRLKGISQGTLIYQASYEKDSDFVSSMLHDFFNLNVWRKPSPNPISVYYHQAVAQGMMITTPYQREELQAMDNPYIEKTQNIPPPEYQILDKIRHQKRPIDEPIIGFISNGVWRRKERGDTDFGTGEVGSENDLIEALALALTNHPSWRLQLFLHPCEKSNAEMHHRAIEHYEELLPKSQLLFPDFGLNSRDISWKANVAVSVNSSFNSERLYMGHKSLFFPKSLVIDVFEKTLLHSISSRNADELIMMIERALPQTEQEFFEANDVQDFIAWGAESIINK